MYKHTPNKTVGGHLVAQKQHNDLQRVIAYDRRSTGASSAETARDDDDGGEVDLKDVIRRDCEQKQKERRDRGLG